MPDTTKSASTRPTIGFTAGIGLVQGGVALRIVTHGRERAKRRRPTRPFRAPAGVRQSRPSPSGPNPIVCRAARVEARFAAAAALAFRERPPRSSARTPCPGTRVGVSHPNKRSRRRFSEPRAADFAFLCGREDRASAHSLRSRGVRRHDLLCHLDVPPSRSDRCMPAPEHRARVTRLDVSRPCKRSRRHSSEPRAVDFRLSSPGHRDRRARHHERTARSSRRARRSRTSAALAVDDSRVGLDDGATGPRDRHSGIDDRGIGRVDRHSRHHDRRCCHG